MTDYYAPGTPSYSENAEGYGLTRETMKWFWDHYLNDPSEGTTRTLRRFAHRYCQGYRQRL